MILYPHSAEIDAAWESVAKAVVSGSLGHCAKVSTCDPKKPTHVICVYTEDFTNEAEVRAAEWKLRELGIKINMHYKPDVYTTLGIYGKNQWGLKASVYSSYK